jgi:hypothetical protein
MLIVRVWFMAKVRFYAQSVKTGNSENWTQLFLLEPGSNEQ